MRKPAAQTPNRQSLSDVCNIGWSGKRSFRSDAEACIRVFTYLPKAHNLVPLALEVLQHNLKDLLQSHAFATSYWELLLLCQARLLHIHLA